MMNLFEYSFMAIDFHNITKEENTAVRKRTMGILSYYSTLLSMDRIPSQPKYHSANKHKTYALFL